MDFYNVPIGFGMALTTNQPVMNTYSKMTEEEKQTILNKAHNVRSEKEMHTFVASLANGTMQQSTPIYNQKIVTQDYTL